MPKIIPQNTAENILARLCASFPSLVLDERKTVDREMLCDELFQWLHREIYGLADPKHATPVTMLYEMLRDRASNGSPENDEENEAGYGL